MRRLTHLPTVTPELLLGAAPPPFASGPFRLSLGGVPPAKRPVLFRECFERLGFRYDIEPVGDMPVEVELSLHVLPGLQLAAGRIHSSRNRRTRKEVDDGTDDIVLIVNRKGPYQVSQGKQEIILGDGEATFVSCSEPCAFMHRPPGDFLALRFPRAQFAPLVNGAEDHYLERIPNGAPSLRLLTDYVGITWSEQAAVSPELRYIIVAQIYDLMAVAIGATRDAAEVAQGRGVRIAKLLAIKQDIARNLDRPDLSVAMLAVRHGCTPRYIQRLFEVEGTTFTEYVLAQRLVRAHRMLKDPRRAGDKIATIALDAGFSDVSYFNRALRQVYGDTPSSIRAARALN